MPPDVDVLYRCNVTWYLLGQNCINSFFFRSKPGNTYPTILAELQELHNQLRSFMFPPMRSVMSNQVQQISSVVTNLNQPPFLIDVSSYTGVVGGVSSTSLPSYCSQVLSWRTAYRGRRLHGRTYIPGVPTSAQNGNQLTSAAQTALSNAAATMLDNFILTERWSYPFLVVFSRKNGTTIVPGPPPTTDYESTAGVPVTRVVPDNTIYTQRHRLEGRGV